MDILRKELDEIYLTQNLGAEVLPADRVMQAREIARNVVTASNGCAVITDASCDRCYIYSGWFGELMGYADVSPSSFIADSSDEDIIYDLLHPEDLVDKRLLEYEFFKFVDTCPLTDKTAVIARCTIRMKDRTRSYRAVDNTTQIIALSPAGKLWLILCTYTHSPNQSPHDGIEPVLLNTRTGEVMEYSFKSRRKEILTEREKEILLLIKAGKPSKQIADILGISIHTVNRHRQNILEKLSVGNSVEAVTAASVMKLL